MFKAIGRGIKHFFSFSPVDVIAILLGLGLVKYSSDTASLFYILSSPQLYIILFLALFLIRSWVWLLIYRGETPYLKHSLWYILKDYVHILTLSICTVGLYLLLFSLL